MNFNLCIFLKRTNFPTCFYELLVINFPHLSTHIVFLPLITYRSNKHIFIQFFNVIATNKKKDFPNFLLIPSVLRRSISWDLTDSTLNSMKELFIGCAICDCSANCNIFFRILLSLYTLSLTKFCEFCEFLRIETVSSIN